MPSFSNLATRTVSTPNSGSRFGVRPQFIVLHHMATTGFEGVLESWRTGRKQGSTHYAISDGGEVVGVVSEKLRAWSLSSASFDSKAIVFEIANSSLGGSWPVSAAAEEATARVVADLCTRYRIPINRDRILGHREVFTRYGVSYATACPGGLHLDWIVARAKAITAGTPPKPPTKVAVVTKTVLAAIRPKRTPWRITPPTGELSRRVQRALRKRGRYAGPVDGVFGPATWRGVQLTTQGAGYLGPIDGVVGVVGAHLIQAYARKFGDYRGPIDGNPGVASWTGFALGLERP